MRQFFRKHLIFSSPSVNIFDMTLLKQLIVNSFTQYIFLDTAYCVCMIGFHKKIPISFL